MIPIPDDADPKFEKTLKSVRFARPARVRVSSLIGNIPAIGIYRDFENVGIIGIGI